MNFAGFIEWITYKENVNSKNIGSHTNYIFKVPLYGSTFTIKFKKPIHMYKSDGV
jgi:hypothetical protein